MKTRRLVGVLVIAAAMSLVLLAGARAGQMMAQPTSVACVDLERIFKEVKEKAQIEVDLKGKAEKFEAQRKEREDKMKKVQDDLAMLNPQNPAHQAKFDEANKLVMENQVWEQWQMQQLQRENLVQVQGLYVKIVEATEKLGKDAGIDIILYKEAMPDFKQVKASDMSQVIRSRKVVYCKDSLDLTQQVITAMNNEFGARKPK